MRKNKSRRAASTDNMPGTRKLFYGSIGLLLAGLLILAIGAIYSLPLLVLVGAAGFLGFVVMQLNWLVRKIR